MALEERATIRLRTTERARLEAGAVMETIATGERTTISDLLRRGGLREAERAMEREVEGQGAGA